MTEAQKEAKRRAEVMLAFSEGDEVQVRNAADPRLWLSCENPLWNWEHGYYRIKPVPASRPWGPQDVPPVCWLSASEDIGKESALVDRVREFGVSIASASCDNLTISWEGLQADWLYSIDRKTWAKCEVST